MNGSVPQLTEGDLHLILTHLQARLPGYVPGWSPRPGRPGWALIQIYARYLQTLAERLNLAPDKNKLAFFDLLGLHLLPSQAARAPLVFQAISRVGDSRVPVRTQVGAKVPDQAGPLVFETDKAIALAAAQLMEVVTLWPGKDAYADHSRAALGHQPFTLFEPLQPVPHELHLAHETLLALAGEVTVELQVELAQPGSHPLATVWEYWDGQTWRPFKEPKSHQEAGDKDSLDGTGGFTRSGVIRLVADCAETKKTKINGVTSYWLRGTLKTVLPRDPSRILPLIDRIQLRTSIQKTFADKLYPDLAFADSSELDLSKSFYPFGQQPQPGSTFYFSSQEVFSKAGAAVNLTAQHVETPQAQQNQGSSSPSSVPTLIAEYWNGFGWQVLADLESQTDLIPFIGAGATQEFTVPADVTTRRVGGKEGLWLRIRIVEGGFYRTRTIQWTDQGGGSETNGNGEPGDTLGLVTASTTNTIVITETLPPALTDFRLLYEYHSPWTQPEWCFTYNDFRWIDQSETVRWRGATFEPFSPVEDTTPTLYLGFDRPLPADLVSLYLDIEEVSGRLAGPRLQWEYWRGSTWSTLTIQDETDNLTLPGMVEVLWPGTPALPTGEVAQASGSQVQLTNIRQAAQFRANDLLYLGQPEAGELVTVAKVSRDTLILKAPLSQVYQRAPLTLAALPRFGTPRTWLRARLQADSEPEQSQVKGIHLNAVWAAQIQTIENEVLGSSLGQANEVFFFRQTPVLPHEVVEVRELSGPRAAIELPLLREELARQGLDDAAIRTVTDPQTGKVNEVWVRWQFQPNLFFSGPGDRHYLLERRQGRLLFGDDQYGRIPPAGVDNVRVRLYRSGGGLVGNVPAGAINQRLSGVMAEGVTNPRAAEGGADGETMEELHQRAPQVTRHRYQAITLADYEALAREASPAVAVARALPTTHASGRSAAGWVKLIIMPQSQDPQPQPSFELRRRVQNFLAARIPASIADRLTVTGPDYLPIGVEAEVAPVDLTAAGMVFKAVTETLALFFNPLAGGPEGAGWPFGRDVYLSDVAAVLENVAGVDYVRTLHLLLDNTPQGERVAVPPDRIVVAGPMQITLTGSER